MCEGCERAMCELEADSLGGDGRGVRSERQVVVQDVHWVLLRIFDDKEQSGMEVVMSRGEGGGNTLRPNVA